MVVCSARWKVTIPRAIIFGVLVGLAAATMYLQQVSWPPGVLLWTGGLGGGATAMVFVFIAGKQPNPPLETTASIRAE